MRFNEFKIKEDAGRFFNMILGKDPGFGISDVIDKIKPKDNNTTTDKDSTNKTDKPTTKDTKDTKSISDPTFDGKLNKVAEALGVDPAHLRKIIRFETAGTFSPTSHDPWNVSVGLIGFTEQTARGLGTSKAELAKMTAVQQLDYVYKFYKRNGLRPGSDVGTMYMLTFMPAYAYAPDSKVLGKKNGGKLDNTGLSMHMVWKQNPGFSGGGPQNKPGSKTYFTVGDVKSLIRNR
jgi:hypothetical protein